MLKIYLATLTSLGLALSSFAAAADECPSTLYYSNGSYLKSGSSLYYPNGSYLKSGSSLYYPNGSYLKSGSSLYYSNGSYLKSGTSYYYPNGSYARSGTQLYRQDGSYTEFPVSLSTTINDYGRLDLTVSKNSAAADLDFKSLISESLVKLVELRGFERFISEDQQGLVYVLELRTGASGEVMYAEMSEDGTLRCRLDGRRPGGENFTLRSSAADIDVQVKNVRDVQGLRAALERTLREFENR